jgi:hypothetical protein
VRYLNTSVTLLLRAFAEFHKKAFKVENGYALGSIERWIEQLILYDAWKDCDIVGSSTRLIYSRLDVRLPTDKVLNFQQFKAPATREKGPTGIHSIACHCHTDSCSMQKEILTVSSEWKAGVTGVHLLIGATRVDTT